MSLNSDCPRCKGHLAPSSPIFMSGKWKWVIDCISCGLSIPSTVPEHYRKDRYAVDHTSDHNKQTPFSNQYENLIYIDYDIDEPGKDGGC